MVTGPNGVRVTWQNGRDVKAPQISRFCSTKLLNELAKSTGAPTFWLQCTDVCSYARVGPQCPGIATRHWPRRGETVRRAGKKQDVCSIF